MTDHDAITIAKKIRYDLTELQAKVTALLNELGRLNLPAAEQHTCDTCGLDLRGPAKLAEHRYVSHDGPLPHHWARAEALAADPTSNTTNHDQAAPA